MTTVEERQKTKKKSMLSFLCCSCFSTKKKPKNVERQIPDINEPYDYVVEKLVIKKLPLSAFATAEDLIKYNRMALKYKGTQPIKQSLTPPPLKRNRPSTSTNSHASLMKHEYLSKMYPKPVSIEDREGQMVASILNKHASLFSLDDKAPFPKDPLNPPRNTVVVPKRVQKAFQRNDLLMPKLNMVQVEHLPIIPQLKQASHNSTGIKDMSPDIQKTICALGVAQRSHLPGEVPKNQKRIHPTITATATEKELTNKILPRDLSFDSPKVEPKLSFNEYQVEKQTSTHLGTVPRNEQEKVINNIFFSRDALTNKHSDSKFKNSTGDTAEVGIRKVPSSTTVESLQEKPTQNFDINQMKGQNLKWKIIIKRHAGAIFLLSHSYLLLYFLFLEQPKAIS
ncbi:hypothetical protein FQA39_LY13102 [Lamprigera yunnana]|nr:hypothetical protein FQA39_LY13102 [Lamprigera yunnana]